MIYTDLQTERKLAVLDQVSAQTNSAQQTIEKDWWVTQVLKAIFSLPYAEHLSFKGGTSLSKCWHLIERFSEDVDIAISRDFLGFSGELSRTQVSDKLRRAACSFVREKMQYDVREAMIAQGIKEDRFSVRVQITSVSTTDPETIEIEYKSALPENSYIRHCVLIEVSGRSMQEPVKVEQVQSLIDQYVPQSIVAEQAFSLPNVVAPERTCLEKIFLLHEEFAKPNADIRVNRMTRHLYDLYCMKSAGVVDRALHDEALYRAVVEHRRKFINLRDFDYDTLYPKHLSLEIPANVLELWRKDYETMQRTMIYGQSVAFDELLAEIRQLNMRISELPY
jgi:predicted nucleotidyltransferase component of viral defense system